MKNMFLRPHGPLAAGLLAALLGGCAKKAPAETQAPAAGAGDAADDLDTLEGMLATRESQLRGAGVALPAWQERAEGEALNDETRAGGDADANAGGSTAATEPPATSPAPAPEVQRERRKIATDDGDRCETVCDLTTAICQLQDQICGLAPRHPGDARYQAACERATGDCRYATEACHACA